MQYNINNGKDLLNRMSVMYDYLAKCEANSKASPDDAHQIATNFITFMNEFICNHGSFTYDNVNAPQAFQLNGTKLTMHRIDFKVSNILDKTWNRVIKQLNIYWPQNLIDNKQQLSTKNLIKMTEFPHQYIQWHHQNVETLDIHTLSPLIHRYFTKDLIRLLINQEGDTQHQAIPAEPIRQSNPSHGLDYHFTSTKDFINHDDEL